MIGDKILKSEERAVYTLRSLFKHYGYLPFKMSKFEEYDLYVRNKDFLIGDSVITFNDTNGRLLALKPDVTLSIIKNTVDGVGVKHKVYYDENVYRVSAKTHRFKEIMQTGVECIGDIDLTDVYEVVYLAAKSLDTVSADFALDLSHMGLFSALLDEVSTDKLVRAELTRLISRKSTHEARALCEKYGIEGRGLEIATALSTLYGEPDRVLEILGDMCVSDRERDALDELAAVCRLLSSTDYYGRIKLDFSVVSDMRYYDGIIFKGFLNGIPEAILSGGEYDPLMRRMGRQSGAIGFALYLDLLEELKGDAREYDVDCLLIYSEKTEAEKVALAKEKIIALGESVYASRVIPEKIRYKRIVMLDKEEI